MTQEEYTKAIYTDNGAFEDDGMDRFLVDLDRLMTRDEFL